MDGNGRWATKKGLPRSFGHNKGVSVLKEILKASKKLGCKVLTVYAFSTENWTRPTKEVDFLINLFTEVLKNEIDEIHEESIKIKFIGDLSPFLTTEIRLLGAIIFLISLKGFKINFFLKNIEKKQQKRFLISIFLGTNLGILLQQIVFKTLPIGIGWALLSISPVISLFFAKNEEKEITNKIIIFTCFLFFGLTLIIL